MIDTIAPGVHAVDWDECRRREREECALVIEELRENMPEILLCCGEMTGEERRVARSVLMLAAFKVRQRISAAGKEGENE